MKGKKVAEGLFELGVDGEDEIPEQLGTAEQGDDYDYPDWTTELLAKGIHPKWDGTDPCPNCGSLKDFEHTDHDTLQCPDCRKEYGDY